MQSGNSYERIFFFISFLKLFGLKIFKGMEISYGASFLQLNYEDKSLKSHYPIKKLFSCQILPPIINYFVYKLLHFPNHYYLECNQSSKLRHLLFSRKKANE